MRVTHISPTSFGPDGLYGGGERYPVEMARALSRHLETRLVTFGPRPMLSRDPSSSLEIVTLRTLFRFKRHPVHPAALGLATATRTADIIHAHHMRAAPSRQAALLGKLRNQPVCVTDHGLGGGGWGGLLPKMFDAFLNVSDHSGVTLSAPPERSRTIYGGADPLRFFPGPDGERRGVLFVGRITPHKGLDRLLEALPDKAHLTVAGTIGHDRRLPEAGYPQVIRAQAGPRDVRFTGQVAEQDLPALHRSAQVFVLPSVDRTCFDKRVAISELLGLSVLEAMASGTPVVASRIGGVPEIVRHDETGFLVEPGNVAELRQRIGELLGNRALATRMGAAAREHVLDRFTWVKVAERTARAYEDLLSGAL
jgi:glycosyltransferase involved in cell wall biosynthesis